MRKNQYVGSKKIIFGLVGSSFIANLISFILTPVIARIYDPQTIGIFFGLLGVSSISSVVISRKAEINIPLLKSNKKAIELLVSNLLSSFTLILLFNLFIFLITVFNFIDSQNIINLYKVEFTLITFTLIIYANLTQLSLRNSLFKQIRDRNLLQPIIVVLLQIILGFKYPSVTSLTSAEVMGRVTSFARTILLTAQIINRKIVVNALKRKNFFFLSKAYQYFVFDSIFSVFFLIFIIYKYGSNIGGQFAISWKIATAPAALFGLAIGQFLIMKISRSRNKKQKIRLIVGELKWILGTLSSLFSLGLLFTGFFFLEPLLGPNWSSSGDFLIVLTLFSVTNMLWIVFANLTVLIDRQEILQLSAKIKMASLSVATSMILFSDIHSVTAVLILANISSVTDLISIKIAWKAIYR
jgi:O-antigen/teichoic acid export membrane protein